MFLTGRFHLSVSARAPGGGSPPSWPSETCGAASTCDASLDSVLIRRLVEAPGLRCRSSMLSTAGGVSAWTVVVVDISTFSIDQIFRYSDVYYGGFVSLSIVAFMNWMLRRHRLQPSFQPRSAIECGVDISLARDLNRSPINSPRPTAIAIQCMDFIYVCKSRGFFSLSTILFEETL